MKKLILLATASIALMACDDSVSPTDDGSIQLPAGTITQEYLDNATASTLISDGVITEETIESLDENGCDVGYTKTATEFMDEYPGVVVIEDDKVTWDVTKCPEFEGEVNESSSNEVSSSSTDTFSKNVIELDSSHIVKLTEFPRVADDSYIRYINANDAKQLNVVKVNSSLGEYPGIYYDYNARTIKSSRDTLYSKYGDDNLNYTWVDIKYEQPYSLTKETFDAIDSMLIIVTFNEDSVSTGNMQITLNHSNIFTNDDPIDYKYEVSLINGKRNVEYKLWVPIDSITTVSGHTIRDRMDIDEYSLDQVKIRLNDPTIRNTSFSISTIAFK